MASMFNANSLSSTFNNLKSHADKMAKEAQNLAKVYGKEASKKVQAALGKEQVLVIGSRQVKVLELLAEGGYAYVYRCEDMATGQYYALKRMLIQDDETISLAEHEIEIMKKLSGKPYCIQFFGSIQRRIEQPRAMEYFVLMELCTGGSLMDAISRRNKAKFKEEEIASLFYQISVAVSHLHKFKPPMAHRDLKIENVLISTGQSFNTFFNNPASPTSSSSSTSFPTSSASAPTEPEEMRLCDFGSCTSRAQIYTTREEMTREEENIQKYSTSMYRAPEMVDLYKKQLINEKVDIWALGCILFTLAFFTQPFQDGGNLQIIGGSYKVPEEHPYSPTMVKLIKKLLTLTPMKRPDIDKTLVLIKKWIKELNGKGKKVVIPDSSKKKTAAKKKKDESSDEDDEEDDDDEDEEEDESTSKKVRKPGKGGFGDDFEADFGANSPSSPSSSHSLHASQSFPNNFPNTSTAAHASTMARSMNGNGALAASSSNKAPISAVPFDMSAFADSLVGGSSTQPAAAPKAGPPSQQPRPMVINSTAQPISFPSSPNPGISPPTLMNRSSSVTNSSTMPRSASGSTPLSSNASAFDFFGGGSSTPEAAISPRGGSRQNSGVPVSAQGIAASLPTPKALPKPAAAKPSVAAAAAQKKKSVQESSSEEDSSDEEESDSESDDEDEAHKKRAAAVKKAQAGRR